MTGERERLEHRIRHLIIDVLRDEAGDDAIIYRTYDGVIVPDQSDWSILSWPEPADPLEAMKLADYIERVAGGLWRRYGEQARGAGKTWLEVADALGIPADEDERDHQAFMKVAGEPTSWYGDRYLSWKCASCGERVRDLGPYGGHPDDCESGHAEGCRRHRMNVARYTAQWEDD